MKKVLIITGVVLLAILIGVFSFLYLGIYDEGIRAGTVLRISKKGVIWKTYEGQLALESFGALKKVSPLAETFDFSVERGNDSIVRLLESVALSGERVNLRYIKRYMVFPWRGKTMYFVRGVERGPNPETQSPPPGLFRH
ncbi:MAG: 6-phosphogluconate dehydrogenase [Bacteroidetes bacterium]|nr:MAG: 6-phosphogluconate dehydrogenase [Bacteroidota bacterium]